MQKNKKLKPGETKQMTIHDDSFTPLLKRGDVITVEAIENNDTDGLLLVEIADTYHLARVKFQQGYLFVYDYGGLLIGKYDELDEMTLPVTIIGRIKNLP